MGKVINISENWVKKLRDEITVESPTIESFLEQEYGDTLKSGEKDILVSIYRLVCQKTGKRLDPSILGKPGKRGRALRKF